MHTIGELTGSLSIVYAMMHHGICDRHGPVWAVAFNQDQAIPDLNMTFTKDPEIPAGTSGILYMNREILDTPSTSQLPAWLSWLRDLDKSLSNFKYISDAHIALQQAGSCKVFPKCSWTKVW